MGRCAFCGEFNYWTDILCAKHGRQFRTDFDTGHIPAPLKDLPKDLLYSAFGERDWAEVRSMDVRMQAEGKSPDEIRAAVNAYAEERKQAVLRGHKLLQEEEERKKQLLDGESHYSY